MTTISAYSGSILRFYALCGITAPIFFAMMVTVENFLVPGYNQVSQYISDLGAYSMYGSYALLQNLNFWIFSSLVLTFAVGLRRGWHGSTAVTVSLGLFASMVFLAGVFPDEPTPLPGEIHGLVSIVAFFSIILCQFFAWIRLRRTEFGESSAWGRFRVYSLVSGLLTFALLFPAVILPHDVSFGQGYKGAWESLFIAVPWLWIEVMGLKLFGMSTRMPAADSRPS
jgi:hypothetical membrane protein